MAALLDSMSNYIMGNVPNSQEQQQKVHTDIVNQTMSYQLAQQKLQSDANNQLLPLQIESQKNELQDKIGKAQLSMFMQPYQKAALEASMDSSFATGADPKTGMTGQSDIDASIQKAQQNVMTSIALKPENAGSQLADLAKFTDSMRKTAQERKTTQLNSFIERVGYTPKESILREAEANPGDPKLQAYAAYFKENPDATKEDAQSMLGRTFGMDADDREKLISGEKKEDDLVKHWGQTLDETKKNHETAHEDKIKSIELAAKSHQLAREVQERALEARLDTKNTDRETKLDATSSNTVQKAVSQYNDMNKDVKARGFGQKITAINTLEGMSGGQPVTKNSIYTAITPGNDGDAEVNTKQIQGLNVVQSQLASFYTNSGQRSVKDILGQTRTAGIIPSVLSKFDAFVFGDGNVKLANSNERLQFSQLLSEVHDNMVKEVGSAQVAKTNQVLLNPNVKPQHKLEAAQNIAESPSTLTPTLQNVGTKLFKDLDRRGIETRKEDDAIIKDVQSKLTNPKNRFEAVQAAQKAILIYQKYALDKTPQTPQNSNIGDVAPIVPPINATDDQLRDMMRGDRLKKRGQ